ncbi:single-stranded DNA-binding protein [Alphaproteobacteria bacterium]|jgi:single-strand DNA-binding protein|nr:single-stranded DNA-binding protein [Alphaproteobacteria bacterium]MDB3863603.1 single-stranded DNA-binding protein [Alphaproteobacteria bacterium]MDB3973521.1 single-stranded DNA-binding protein [Alphaproteobacteria bacterium]MDC0594557.1 single-stranded DNA-binding protein [Alphaproteobacteria bacterium]MDC0968193.1 single-stranded DNA-binding protein [Alphaproteobacteria bacterium]|tara:strand:- start:117 stop:584 length:468 start_codon:yes stop_codon:yes gene_type:complete
MAGSVNKVILLGNLGKDPDIRATSTGSRLASFSIATSTKYRNKDTQQLEDKTEWHRIVVFNDKLADICEKYLRKGSKIYIEGQLQTRKWTDNNGVDKYTTEVVIPNYSGVLTMLDSRAQSSVSEENTSQLDSAADEALGGSDNSTAEQLDDDIPF